MSIGEVLYCLGLIGLMTYLIFRFRPFSLPGISKKWVLFAFLIKIVAGFFMTFIYTSYYPDRSKADIFKYFDDSEVMYEAIRHEPIHYVRMVTGINNDNSEFDSLYYSNMNHWYRKYETVTYNDSHTIIRLNALFRLVSFGYFHVHNIFFIILSFIGLMALFKMFSKYFSNKTTSLFAAVFLVPSVVFWSSGAMKESVLFFATGVFLYAFQQLIFISFSMWRLFAMLGAAALLVLTKMYVFAVLIPVLAANLWIILSDNRNVLLKYLISTLVFINLAIAVSYIWPEYNVFQLFVGKQHDFIGLAMHEQAGSFVNPLPVEPRFLSFLSNAPMALVNTLLRPFPGEIASPLMWPAVFENVVLVICIILAIFFHQKSNHQSRMIWFCIFFSLTLAVILGITTPVLGALVRYRAPLMPFLLAALFLMIDFDRIRAILNIKQTNK